MVKLTDIDLPMIFENRLLFSHGVHNNWNILPSEIGKSFDLTNWTDQRNRSLYFSHSERDAQKWVGRINNPHIVNGELFGDLEIHDADLALKLGPGRAPIGVSAEIRWPQQFAQPTDFTYRGFAMVPNPELPETMINFSQQNTEGFNSAKIHIPFTEKQADFNEEEPVDNGGVITSVSARGTKVEEDTQADFSKESKEEVNVTEEKITVEEKDESNLMSAERGLNKKMEENNAKDVTPEVKGGETVETVEETTEEPEVKEEESKDADFSALNDKIDALSAKVSALEEKQAEFSKKAEEAEEEVEEVKEEEVKEPVKEEVTTEEEPEVKEEESTEKVEESEVKADFSKDLVEKIDKLADAIGKKEAAPMSTAEFGAKGTDKENAVVDRLTKSLSN